MIALNRLSLLVGLLLAPCLFAQLDPQGAQVISYFPQLADGGPASQKWITSLTLVNPDIDNSAIGIVYLYADSGQPLALDFGNGPASTVNLTLPPQGTVTLQSQGASPTTVTGWAVVTSTLPLEGVVRFRFSANGVPQQGVAAQSTPASGVFRAPAMGSTGIAVVNIYSQGSINVQVQVLDAGGSPLAQNTITLGPLQHRSFTLSQFFSGIPSTFRGSVIVSTPAPQEFVAWTLSSDLGVLSSDPPAGLGWPVSQYERIWKVWLKVLNVAGPLYSLNPLPKLVIDNTTDTINSFANPATNEVHIFTNLAELISDSESELSFVVGHEIGHIIQGKVGLRFVPGNPEEDADQYGMLLSLLAGYDPYGAAGALAKLSMASGEAGLLAQNFDSLTSTLGGDPHGSFNDRLALIFSVMQAVCALPQAQAVCAEYKYAVHPHLPASAPLVNHGVRPVPPAAK